ncbi:MAG: hypothetical protein OSB63_02935 [Planctomycetota bacterium]|nr:hypothetical protein [Planctomycetota bacterium]
MTSVSILALSSLLALAQNPEPHTQKVIVKNGEVITELGSEEKTGTSKEISITIHASDAHEILNGIDRENGVKVMGRVKMITIDEDGNEQTVEFDLDDMPEGFDFDIQQLGAGSLDGLPEMLEMMRGPQGDLDLEIDMLHGDSEHEGWGGEHGEHDEHGQRDEHGEHDGAWMFGRSDMGNNMPRMMDMGNMGQFMIMAQPMMMGQNRNPWGDNNRGNNDMVEEMHHRIDNLEEMVDEMHHRIDDLEGSLENIESMLHELLERR